MPNDPTKLFQRVLHDALDRLVARWLVKSGKRPSQATILELLRWSQAQAYGPNDSSQARPGEAPAALTIEDMRALGEANIASDRQDREFAEAIARALRAEDPEAVIGACVDAIGRALVDEPRTHILRGGFAICGFSDRVPGEWPAGHTWVRLEDGGQATCRACLVALAQDTCAADVAALERTGGESPGEPHTAPRVLARQRQAWTSLAHGYAAHSVYMRAAADEAESDPHAKSPAARRAIAAMRAMVTEGEEHATHIRRAISGAFNPPPAPIKPHPFPLARMLARILEGQSSALNGLDPADRELQLEAAIATIDHYRSELAAQVATCEPPPVVAYGGPLCRACGHIESDHRAERGCIVTVRFVSLADPDDGCCRCPKFEPRDPAAGPGQYGKAQADDRAEPMPSPPSASGLVMNLPMPSAEQRSLEMHAKTDLLVFSPETQDAGWWVKKGVHVRFVPAGVSEKHPELWQWICIAGPGQTLLPAPAAMRAIDKRPALIVFSQHPADIPQGCFGVSVAMSKELCAALQRSPKGIHVVLVDQGAARMDPAVEGPAFQGGPGIDSRLREK